MAHLIGMTWMVASLFDAIAVGYIGIARCADDLLPRVFVLLSTVLAKPWIAGLLRAAILAAVMSTTDSQRLVSSSALT